MTESIEGDWSVAKLDGLKKGASAPDSIEISLIFLQSVDTTTLSNIPESIACLIDQYINGLPQKILIFFLNYNLYID